MRTFWILKGKGHPEGKSQGFYFEHGGVDWPLWAGQHAGPGECQLQEHLGAYGLPGTPEITYPMDPGPQNAFTGSKSTLCIGKLLKFLPEGIHA